MKPFEKNGGLGSNRLTGETPGADISTRNSVLEPDANREEKQILSAKAGRSDEVKRAHSESDTTKIPSQHETRARPSTRRRKTRIYLP